MAPNRRSVIKTIGAVGVGAATAVGSVSAERHCVDTVFKVTRSGFIPPVVFFASPTFTIDEGAFEGAAFDGKRIAVKLTWNQIEDAPNSGKGPNSATAFLQRQNPVGMWETIGFMEGEGDIFPIGPNVPQPQPMAANKARTVAVNDTVYEGSTPSGETEGTPVKVWSGETYRLYIRPDPGPIDYQVTAKAQAFDPDC
jgi:hypothetical protein